jgi:hypothetical protein
MRKQVILLLGLSLMTGCIHFPEKHDAKPAAAAEVRPAVKPEQVRETNAHAIADALDAEVKTDETTSPKPEEPKPATKK